MNERKVEIEIIAECILVGTVRTQLWRVGRCPFCGKTHWHDAGHVNVDNPRDFLGKCTSLCLDQCQEYILVERPVQVGDGVYQSVLLL